MLRKMANSSGKRTFANVVSSILVLCTNVLISFWLSPYITEHIGVEANGFVTLANNFVTYAQLIVLALNSMACRFISISYVKGDKEKAILYYNSVFWGKLVIVIFFLLPATYLIIRLQYLIQVPERILWDVKTLFGFVFFNFFLNTAAPNWECGTYITNRLERKYIPQVFTQLLRCIILYLALTILVPRVYYVGVAATFSAILLLIVGWYNTRMLTPELKIYFAKGKRRCSLRLIKELIGSGIWNTISNVGNILISGLDLFICNLFIDATAMGVLAIARIIPHYMQQLSISIRNAFSPEMVIHYAREDRDSLYRGINRAMKLTSIVMTIPIAIVIVLGKDFFALWQPTQNANTLQILSVLSILGYMFTSGTQILYSVFTTVNKVKQNSIAMLLSGVASCGITILFVKYTSLGIYAVGGVSTVCNLIRNMCFTLPATAKYLGYKWYRFYPQVGMTVLCSFILIGAGMIVRHYCIIDSWLTLTVIAVVLGALYLIINVLIILSKEDRDYLFKLIKRKLGK